MTRTLSYLVLVPRNLCVVILRAYRAVISPLYGDVCRYYPSCSAYAMQAIQEYGVVRGVWLGTRRIARCHPWAAGGVDDVPPLPHSLLRITDAGFVLPPMATAGMTRAERDGLRLLISQDPTPAGMTAEHSHGKV